jgi:hypothetical protein
MQCWLHHLLWVSKPHLLHLLGVAVALSLSLVPFNLFLLLCNETDQ